MRAISQTTVNQEISLLEESVISEKMEAAEEKAAREEGEWREAVAFKLQLCNMKAEDNKPSMFKGAKSELIKLPDEEEVIQDEYGDLLIKMPCKVSIIEVSLDERTLKASQLNLALDAWNNLGDIYATMLNITPMEVYAQKDNGVIRLNYVYSAFAGESSYRVFYIEDEEIPSDLFKALDEHFINQLESFAYISGRETLADVNSMVNATY